MLNTQSSRTIEDCFYEKLLGTSLHGHNYVHERWHTEYDCFSKCLNQSNSNYTCKSFENWFGNDKTSLCVQANISFRESPQLLEKNSYVNYYEISCVKDTKAVRLISISCPGDHLDITVVLNGIDPNYVYLGGVCKPSWSNQSHALFSTNVDRCSLVNNFLCILSNSEIRGKLCWDSVYDQTTSKKYERYFTCPSDIHRIRTYSSTSSTFIDTIRTSTISMIYNTNDRELLPSSKISLLATIETDSQQCNVPCTISIFSSLNVIIETDFVSLQGDEIMHEKYFDYHFWIESCDLLPLSPYTKYIHPQRLIFRNCPTDPSLIFLGNNTIHSFSFNFNVHSILKESVYVYIQCQILFYDNTVMNNDHFDKLNNSCAHHLSHRLKLFLNYKQQQYHHRYDINDRFYSFYNLTKSHTDKAKYYQKLKLYNSSHFYTSMQSFLQPDDTLKSVNDSGILSFFIIPSDILILMFIFCTIILKQRFTP
ncbi:unnamed protein product [Didymodactylos carnosus]|uniref:Apple domain-containing protein n=1 Tax=Didymodactylos carnosus TaxID=1234261 RepID=A0A814YYC2_9BILA|nr:unnamed protein product [Didymodactylos carnosus]CAF3998691.1 unnamed protein product [Didymodactylos carnosus]